MIPPKCKICGGTHWGPCHTPDRGGSSAAERQPSKLGVAGSIPARRSKSSNKAPAADARLEDGAAQAAPILTAAVAKRGRPATGFDKKAYQRELMRKRRAAKTT